MEKVLFCYRTTFPGFENEERLKKTFSGVKLSENYTNGHIFEKKYSKKVKKFFLAKNGQKLDFSQNGPDKRIPDQIFWIQHSIWI